MLLAREADLLGGARDLTSAGLGAGPRSRWEDKDVFIVASSTFLPAPTFLLLPSTLSATGTSSLKRARYSTESRYFKAR